MIFSAQSRARVREAERHWVAKFVLRVLCMFFSLLALILAGVSFGVGSGGYSYLRALGVIWIMIPVGVSVVWNAANIIVRLVRPRPMHPGANVGMDLVIWLAFIPTLIFSYASSIIFLANDSYSSRYFCRNYSSSYYSSSYSSSSDCSDSIQREGAIGMAACVFATLSLILHFTLFIWACIDTHRRNHAGVEDRAAQMAATMVTQMQGGGAHGHHQPMSPQGYYPPPAGHHQSMPYPQHPQQQMYQPPGYPPQAHYGGGSPVGPPPPGVGTAYAQHQSFHDANAGKGYAGEPTRDVNGGLAPGHGGEGHSPALSSVSPVARSDENQPEVAAHQQPIARGGS